MKHQSSLVAIASLVALAALALGPTGCCSADLVAPAGGTALAANPLPSNSPHVAGAFGSGSDDGMGLGLPPAAVHVPAFVGATISAPVFVGFARPDNGDEEEGAEEDNPAAEDDAMDEGDFTDEEAGEDGMGEDNTGVSIDESMPGIGEEVPGDVVEFADGVVEPAPTDPNLLDAVRADRRRFLVARKLDTAREQMRVGDFAAARRSLLEVTDIDPVNTEARAMLREVEGLLGNRASGAGQYAEERTLLAKIRIDEQRTRASKSVNVGRMHAGNDRFDSAIEAFEDALFIMNTSPYSVDWGTLRKEAEDGLRQARTAQAAEQKMRRREAVEEGLTALAQEREQELIREMERLAQWMGAGIEAYERNQFDLAENYAQRILDAQPDNTRASELQLASRRARHEKRECDYLRDEKIKFREWYDDIQMTRIAQDKILKWPSRSFWERITETRASSRPTFGEVENDPEAAALRRRVESTNVTVTVQEQPFREVIASLQVQTGFNIVIDPRVAQTLDDRTVTGLILTDTRLETVLDLLRNQGGDDGIVWTTKGNTILFTNKEFLNKATTIEIHSVADLTAGLTDFIPPTIRLVGPDDVSDEENPLFGAEAEEPVRPYGTADELAELVKGAVAPEYWAEGGEMNPAPDGRTLVVKATPAVQRQVAEFLNDLRGFAGIVVTVESRFLEISENFLRDVGLDFRGLGGATPGTLVNLDDVTNGLEDGSSAGFDNGGTGILTGAALNPSAGAYYNDGTDGDFRARTENMFDNPLGTVLSSVGGASLTLSVLDDTQVSMIVRATEKTLNARILTAPIITVYNTQRANLTMVNQLSYVQDFDVEVAQTSFIADPIVGIIQDGLTLDVRPTVSNDRRYITLELQPTVARLRRPIQEFATSLASSFAPVIIQLPELRLQQARTTVRIPDQGSILIGGLKEIRTVDRQSETPFLGKLPLLSFLFSRKGRSDETGHLMIIVRAQITDLLAEEEDFMGGGSAR